MPRDSSRPRIALPDGRFVSIATAPLAEPGERHRSYVHTVRRSEQVLARSVFERAGGRGAELLPGRRLRSQPHPGVDGSEAGLKASSHRSALRSPRGGPELEAPRLPPSGSR